MSTAGMIAGSLGVTLILGGMGIGTAGAAAVLVLLAPQSAEPSLLRQAVVDQSQELGWCAEGLRGGELTLTLVARKGKLQHVGIREATVQPEVAKCMADSLLSLSLPRETTSAEFVVRVLPAP